jgi:hypothetical protein
MARKRETKVGSEVLATIVIESSVFWDITPCIPLKINPHFGGHVASTFKFRKQGKQEARVKVAALLLICFTLSFPWLIL